MTSEEGKSGPIWPLVVLYVLGGFMTAAYHHEHVETKGGFVDSPGVGAVWPGYWLWEGCLWVVSEEEESELWTSPSEKPNDGQIVHVLYTQEYLESDKDSLHSFHNLAAFDIVHGFVEIVPANSRFREDDASYEDNGKEVIGWRPIK